MDVNIFVSKTLKLLEKERSAEIEETKWPRLECELHEYLVIAQNTAASYDIFSRKREKRHNNLLQITIAIQENCSSKELEQHGVCILKLRITSQSSGLFGRTVLVFEPYWFGKVLPAHNITPGDIVGLSLSKSDESHETIASGVVSRVGQAAIHVAFDDNLDQQEIDGDLQYKLVKLANDVTYKRLKSGLNNLNQYRGERCRRLIEILLGQAEPSPPYSEARDGDSVVSKDITCYNDRLDDSQKEAVRFALHQRDVAIIHGPPGTGKTTTVVEIILQAIKQGLKILSCASSNIAVDNLVERLAKYKTKMVRLGHPARLLPQIQCYSLDAVVSNSDETQVVRTVRSEMDHTLKTLKKTNHRGEKQRLRGELRELRKDLREREEAAVSQVLKRCDVIMSTLTTAGDGGPLKHLSEDHFDIVVIDECSQSLEAACWIALPRAPKCILAGDHLQLPPTIISHEAAKEGLELTLMERLLKLYPGDLIVRMLTTQYRMHEDIMKWPSDQLYESKLKAHHSVKSHLLRDLNDVRDNEDTAIPVLMIDTAGCDLTELDVPDEMSKANEGEVDLACVHIDRLVASGVPQEEIAVIAPYNLQVELLRLNLSAKYPRLEIKSVDGFQGREKEAVVITLVRSNDKGEVGFLAEDRRINVAITRARRHLAVICDSETVGHHNFLKDMVSYLLDYGEVRSAQQYVQEGAIDPTSKRPEYLQTKLDKSAKREEKSAKRKENPKDKNAKTGGRKTQKTIPAALDTRAKGQRDTKKKYPENSENKPSDDAVDMVEMLRDELSQFILDESQSKLKFPSTFNSHQRLQVHEMAERLGLNHVSQGKGKERFIVVSKPTKIETVSKTNTPRSVQSSNDILDENEPEVSEQSSDDMSTEDEPELHPSTEDKSSKSMCGKCDKEIPLANLELHLLRCQGSKPRAIERRDVRPKSIKSSKKKAKNKNNKLEKKEVEDFDTLIAAAMKENSTCAFEKCKTLTATLGQNCEFCTKRFCLSHHIPEVHGCGDSARARARRMISREGVLYSGSGIPSKKPDPNRRANLQRKLDAKLDEMSQKRRVKKKDAEK